MGTSVSEAVDATWAIIDSQSTIKGSSRSLLESLDINRSMELTRSAVPRDDHINIAGGMKETSREFLMKLQNAITEPA